MGLVAALPALDASRCHWILPRVRSARSSWHQLESVGGRSRAPVESVRKEGRGAAAPGGPARPRGPGRGRGRRLTAGPGRGRRQHGPCQVKDQWTLGATATCYRPATDRQCGRRGPCQVPARPERRSNPRGDATSCTVESHETAVPAGPAAAGPGQRQGVAGLDQLRPHGSAQRVRGAGGRSAPAAAAGPPCLGDGCWSRPW